MDLMQFLPQEIVLEICGWLPVISILKLRYTCREYSIITKNNLLWRIIVDRDFCDVSSGSMEPLYETQYQRLLNISRRPQALLYAVTHNYLDAVKYLLSVCNKLTSHHIDTMLRVGNLAVLQLPVVHTALITHHFNVKSDITGVAVLDWLTRIGAQLSPLILTGVICTRSDNVVSPILQWFINHNMLPNEIAKLLIVYNHKQSMIALINSGHVLTSRYANIACKYGLLDMLAIFKRYGQLPTTIGLNYAYKERYKYLLPWLKRNGIVADTKYMRQVIEAHDLPSLQLFASSYQFTLNELLAVLRHDDVAIIRWLLEQGIIAQVMTQVNGHNVPDSGVDSILQWSGGYGSIKILNYLKLQGLITLKGMVILLFEIKRQPLSKDWLVNQVQPDRRNELELLITKVSISGRLDNYQDALKFFSKYVL